MNVIVFVSGIFDILMDSLPDRMGVQPILSVKVSVIIDTMLSFDGDFDEQSDDGTTCKQTCIQGH